MPNDYPSIRRKNLALLAEQTGGRAALARRCGKTTQQISGMLQGQKGFGERIARDIEQKLGLEAGTLDQETMVASVCTSGEALPMRPPLAERITALEARKEYALAEPLKVSKIRVIEFDGEWLYEQQIDTAEPAALRLMSVPSDSMEPVILKGSTVVIDVSQRSLLANGIFAIAYSGSIFIHRVQVLPGHKYVFMSDNPRYQALNLDSLDGVIVVGRVVLINNTHGA